MNVRDIMFRDRTYLVFVFLGSVMKFQAREANRWPRSASSNPIEFVSFLLFFLSFLFLFLPTFSSFSALPLLS